MQTDALDKNSFNLLKYFQQIACPSCNNQMIRSARLELNINYIQIVSTLENFKTNRHPITTHIKIYKENMSIKTIHISKKHNRNN